MEVQKYSQTNLCYSGQNKMIIQILLRVLLHDLHVAVCFYNALLIESSIVHI